MIVRADATSLRLAQHGAQLLACASTRLGRLDEATQLPAITSPPARISNLVRTSSRSLQRSPRLHLADALDEHIDRSPIRPKPAAAS
jgi:hypothetical protein